MKDMRWNISAYLLEFRSTFDCKTSCIINYVMVFALELFKFFFKDHKFLSEIYMKFTKEK